MMLRSVLALLGLLIAAATPAPPRVAVTGGTVEGIAEPDRLVFRGIPFAAPPLVMRVTVTAPKHEPGRIRTLARTAAGDAVRCT